MEIDRRVFIASLGGTTAVGLLSDEAKADALEEFMSARLNAAVAQSASAGQAAAAQAFPSAAELEAQIETRPTRRGVGNLFTARSGNVKRLDKMPSNPRLVDRLSAEGLIVLDAARLVPTLEGLAVADSLARDFEVSAGSRS